MRIVAVNKTDAARSYKVRIEPADKTPLVLDDAPLVVKVPAGAVIAHELEVGAPADAVRGRHDLVFIIEAEDGSAKARVDSTFFGPL